MKTFVILTLTIYIYIFFYYNNFPNGTNMTVPSKPLKKPV